MMHKKSMFGPIGSMFDREAMNKEATIKKASNGFIVTWNFGEPNIAKTFKEATKLVEKYFNETSKENEEEYSEKE